jgi:arsenite methyltransferase
MDARPMAGSYLEMQAYLGISKHNGGLRATRRLLEMCDVARATKMLEVGCGIGAGPVHAARTYGCRVVGVDVSSKMIEWSRRRAREAGVEDRVELHVADVLSLPFADDRFDVTMCESVLAFVADKQRAIAEMIRVTRPGGWVGLSEAFMLTSSPSPRVTELARQMGTEMIDLEEWRALWAESGLADQAIRTYRIDPGREIRDRLRWIGLRQMAAGWARLGWLWISQPSARPLLRSMGGAMRTSPGDEPGTPPPWHSFAYGLFVGRKP